MAKLDVQGFDAFAADLEAAKNLTEEEQRTILTAGAEVLKEWMQRSISSLGLVLSGVLRDSIKIFHKQEDGRPYAEVYPSGRHHVTHGYGPGPGARRGKGSTRTVNAGAVGFVLEYGAPDRGLNAYHWMETAVESSADEVHDAMQEAFNEVLDAKGVGQ